MDNGYISKKSLKQIDQNFKKIGMTALNQFIDNNFTKLNNLAPEAYIPLQTRITRSKNLEYIDDRGSGRISKGVKSLEAITKTLKGIQASSLTLFDQEIYSNPFDFRSYDVNNARTVIYENLGLTEFIPLAMVVSPKIITQLNIMVDKMFIDIKNSTFSYENYINEALPRCKLVVLAAMNFREDM